MNAEQVVDKIISEAKSKAEEIINESNKVLESKRAELSGELKSFSAESERLSAESADDRRNRILSKARMEISKEVLSRKCGLLDEVFSEAKAAIKNLPDDRYISLMEKLILKSVETGDEEVKVGNDESRIDQKFIDSVNAKLSGDGKGNLKLSNERAAIACGFILSRGNIRINVSDEVLVSMAREELEITLANELFPK